MLPEIATAHSNHSPDGTSRSVQFVTGLVDSTCLHIEALLASSGRAPIVQAYDTLFAAVTEPRKFRQKKAKRVIVFKK
ncbi:hypothetical protein QA641_40070 [Bradyrhizobium sp. CB1650]|uniref:hypothetical protein n=1 Tax=Bradyrhizobium sp. CB1650 TaxID=3039153 RepID=UPI0024351AB7|nr:hypothetical protein [Bradyrhizobium sp. CB1650]WGD51565.1 hypothetical protein QA641_40070 [Bradyrhizobium sp. CB1650]